MIENSIAAFIAYLIGSISSAIIVCKIMGLPDPRTEGSRNPGATNVLRIGGKKAAIITLFGDMLKGLLPVLIATSIGLNNAGLAFVALAAFLGHLFPIYFRFEGGKGVATFIGCLLGLCWPAGLCWITTWLVIAMWFRYSSFAALVATALAPIYAWYFTNDFVFPAALAVMGLMLFYRHKENIRKLSGGTESRIGEKKEETGKVA